LPYDISYSYPVHKIPFLDNSSLKNLFYESAKVVLSAFTGGPDTSQVTGNGISMAAIDVKGRDSFLDPFKWLLNDLAVEGRIVAFGEMDHTIENSDIMFKEGCNIGLPTEQFYYLKYSPFPGAELIHEIVNKPLHGQLLQWNPRFPIISFSKSLEFARNHDLAQDQLFPVYCLNEMCDIQFLAEIADLMAQKVEGGEVGPKVWLDGVFLDGCRWCIGLCPALKLQRVVIRVGGEILPCMTGKPMGELTDNMEDLRKNARKIYERIRKDRRCDECPADSRCSKCLFPYPLNQERYCELKRSRLDISGIVTRSNLVNTSKLAEIFRQ
jgi:radical SAM protein with 4Fe4S-binding SPASM domain